MKFASPAEVFQEIEGAARVMVVDASGKKKWKKPAQVLADDKIVLKNNGDPLMMESEPGRPSNEEGSVEDLVDGDLDVDENDDEGGGENVIGQLIADRNKRRERFIKRDKLVRVTKKTPDSPDVADLVLQELAEESAAQKFERTEHEKEGKDISEVSSRRTRILDKLIETWFKRQERLKEVGVVDLNSPAMQIFFKCFIETLDDVMGDLGFKAEEKQTLMNKLSGRIDDEWKVLVRKRMKKAAE